MNRRNFILGASFLAATTTAAPGLARQDASAAAWDAENNMFGNALHLLPTAPDGEIAIVQVFTTHRYEPSGGEGGGGNGFFVIHNNTSEALVVNEVESPDASFYNMRSPSQLNWAIPPGGFNIGRTDFTAGDALPADQDLVFDLKTYTVEEMESYSLEPEYFALQIDSVGFSGSGLGAAITNTHEFAVDTDQFGALFIFNGDGSIQNAHRVSTEGVLEAGATMEITAELEAEIAEGALFLLGLAGEMA